MSRHGEKTWCGPKVSSSDFLPWQIWNVLLGKRRVWVRGGKCRLSIECTHMQFQQSSLFPTLLHLEERTWVGSVKQMGGLERSEAITHCLFVFSHLFPCWDGKRVWKWGMVFSVWNITVSPWAVTPWNCVPSPAVGMVVYAISTVIKSMYAFSAMDTWGSSWPKGISSVNACSLW